MKYYLGIDLGGTNIAVGVINEACEFVAQYKTPTLARRGFAPIVADMAAAARTALAQAGLTERDLLHVGIGAPSMVNPHTGCMIFANNLNWTNADIVAEFKKHMDVDVYLANDADCAAYGEVLAGAAKEYENVLMLTLGTGVGGGIIWHNKIFLGGNGYGCEPGHMTLQMDGEPCTCGRRGCLEAYASVTALIRDTIRAMEGDPTSMLHTLCENNVHKVSGRTAFQAARAGDKAGLAVVQQYIHTLAVGISSFITTLRPQCVILGGGVCNEGEYLLAPLRRETAELTYANNLMPETPILKATLGNDAGIIGAAFLGAALA